MFGEKWSPFISVKSKIIMINDHHLCRFIDLKINNKVMCINVSTCSWNRIHTLTKLNGKNVDNFWKPSLYYFRYWPKKNLSSTSQKDIAIFQISRKIQRRKPFVWKRFSISDSNEIQNMKLSWPKDATHKIWTQVLIL